ncbi:MAG: electron transport complex, RnfABCDGE type, subunit [Anaerocolumna sp.]|jgi:electron transport complex protein RnfE|nr:electron transport complex, RnfABCDGE type, subunit [Anaerocolumna sp.]
MKQNKYTERIFNGIIKENPTFIMMLGMCPTLAVTTSGTNGIYMGLTTTVVLMFSNLLISVLRKVIPDKVRIPAYIVVIATMVTIVEMILKAYIPVLNDKLGIYIPLIVVNCIIMGRAEAYAGKNSVGLSLFDGIGMGLGFTLALTVIGSIRELLGAGTLFGLQITPSSFKPISIFVMAPGAFFVLSILTALQNKFKLPSATNGSSSSTTLSCGSNCAGCSGSHCYAGTNNSDTVKQPDKSAVNNSGKENK